MQLGRKGFSGIVVALFAFFLLSTMLLFVLNINKSSLIESYEFSRFQETKTVVRKLVEKIINDMILEKANSDCNVIESRITRDIDFSSIESLQNGKVVCSFSKSFSVRDQNVLEGYVEVQCTSTGKLYVEDEFIIDVNKTLYKYNSRCCVKDNKAHNPLVALYCGR